MNVIIAALKDKNMKKKNRLLKHLESRLCQVTHTKVKGSFVTQVFIEIIIISAAYALYCFKFFHGIWYLNILIIFSTILFGLNYLDIRLEILSKKFRDDVPKTVRRLRYHLLDTKNISKALEKTVKRSPQTTKYYMERLNKAVDSLEYEKEIEEIKKLTKAEWLKMLCNIIVYCKKNGDEEQVISNNLSKITRIVEFINVQQGLDNAEILWTQIFVFIIPLVGIPLVQMFNNVLFQAMEQQNVYLNYQASIKAATILLVSNVSTLFISWMRKNS